MNMLFQEVGKGVSIGLQHFGKHGDRGGSWEGINLIQINDPAVEKKIDPRKVTDFKSIIKSSGILSNFFNLIICNILCSHKCFRLALRGELFVIGVKG